MFNYLSLGLGGLAGGLIAFGLLSGYNSLVENPRIRDETRTIVEAEARKRTEDAINEVNDGAERARAMRRWCRDNGMRYDFVTSECRK